MSPFSPKERKALTQTSVPVCVFVASILKFSQQPFVWTLSKEVTMCIAQQQMSSFLLKPRPPESRLSAHTTQAGTQRGLNGAPRQSPRDPAVQFGIARPLHQRGLDLTQRSLPTRLQALEGICFLPGESLQRSHPQCAGASCCLLN